MIDTIVFDLDGVILDTEPLWDESNRLFLGAHGATYERDDIKALITGKSLAEGTAIMKERYGFTEDVEPLVAKRKAIIEKLFETKASFMPGFLDFYSSVDGAYRKCIATSMDLHLLDIVDGRLGLRSMFQGNVFTVADVGYASKPAPDLFLFAAQRLGANPQQCVVIEDSPNGVLAAKNAGMRCIALATTFSREILSAADETVDSFAEIGL